MRHLEYRFCVRLWRGGGQRPIRRGFRAHGNSRHVRARGYGHDLCGWPRLGGAFQPGSHPGLCMRAPLQLEDGKPNSVCSFCFQEWLCFGLER